ncbi:NADP-dependent oxidoreductase domain-containing protein [Dioszegia hungarica]|uniref:NADP-dependent oxidoreductase domain-containing protein n=1 Tax=Dioszegia hungarica TaxID=4972 RepID=A0AA38H109_9TREE|nr:NADP-dependent oxidoreductase domain-containing protein [Dioszegia hungarica]KAI9632612.1 NADP-dependent oxidoreductase domain-containing protein [Dioszegia hungarica]
MEYVNLGGSGLKVSKIILGCMTYGSSYKWMVSDEQEAIKHIKYAYDQGINTFDTANVYSAGESEVLLGKMLKQHNVPRESVVIMTKTYAPGDKPDKWGPAGINNQLGLSRKHILASVKDSLERLQLDYIDVLQCHRFDKDTPIEETMHALHDVVRSGQVRYVGMSSCFAWQFQLMQQYAIHNKLTPFISMQNQYNALFREEEREMMPTIEHFGVGCIPWGPLSGGTLARPAAKFSDSERSDKYHAYNKGPSDDEIIAAVEKIAKAKGIPMVHVALAWVLSKPYVTAPIVGVKSIERMDEIIAALKVRLTDEEIKAIEAEYKDQPIKGHSGLQDGVNAEN